MKGYPFAKAAKAAKGTGKDAAKGSGKPPAKAAGKGAAKSKKAPAPPTGKSAEKGKKAPAPAKPKESSRCEAAEPGAIDGGQLLQRDAGEGALRERVGAERRLLPSTWRRMDGNHAEGRRHHPHAEGGAGGGALFAL